MNPKIESIANVWVRWNIKEITGDAAMSEVGAILKKETREAWKKHVKKRSTS